MMGKAKRRRAVLFGSVAVLLGAALGATAWFANRQLFAVGDWTAYLGDNERAALRQAVDGEEPASAAPAELDAPGLALWRTRTVSEGEKGGKASPVAAAGHSDLLPPVSPNVERIEVGRRGAPGYALSISLASPVRRVFDTLSAELEKRGWAPFLEEKDNAGVARRLTKMAPESRSMVFRHKQAPLGCQLLVAPDPKQVGCSTVLLSLF